MVDNPQILLAIAGGLILVVAAVMGGLAPKVFEGHEALAFRIFAAAGLLGVAIFISAFFVSGNQSVQIADLEERIAALTPDTLTDQEYNRLVQGLGTHPGTVVIQLAQLDGGAPEYRQRIAEAFQAAGWQVTATGGVIVPYPDRIKVRSLAQGGLTDAGNALLAAFNSAGVVYDLEVTPQEGPPASIHIRM